jgi:hypothetical protein
MKKRTFVVLLLQRVRIYNAQGGLVSDNYAWAPEGALDVSRLPQGFYTGMVYLKNGVRRSFKFIVNR